MKRHEWTSGAIKYCAGSEDEGMGCEVLAVRYLDGSNWKRCGSGAVAREVLSLAEENAELRAIIEGRGDIRKAQPVLDAALKERDRLTKEVAYIRRHAADLEAFLEWERKNPCCLGGDGWAEQEWWRKRREGERESGVP